MAVKSYDDMQQRAAFGNRIDPLSEIRNAGIVTNGSVLWVKQSADADFVTFQDMVSRDNLAGSINAAISMTRNDRNDYVMIVPADSNAVYSIGTSIDINKARVHMLGVGGRRNGASYAITIQGYGTTAAAGTPIDSEMINVTGGGVEIGNIRVLGTVGTAGAGTLSNGLLLAGTGSTGTAHDLWVHDVTLEMTQASLGTPAFITTPGTVHGALFERMWVGNVAAGLESAGNAGLVALGPGGKRWMFRDSTFVYNAGSVATDAFITSGTGAKELTIFDSCRFISMGTGLITSAVRGSATVGNPIMMLNCSYVGVAQGGTDPTVFKSPVQGGTRAVVYDEGLSVGSAALVAA